MASNENENGSTQEAETEKETEKKEAEYEILREDYPNYDLSFKVIVIGNSGIFKLYLNYLYLQVLENLVYQCRQQKKKFENNYLATVGFEFFAFNMKIDGKVIKLQIWDTCGQEIYRSLITSFYKNSSLAIIVYAIDE